MYMILQKCSANKKFVYLQQIHERSSLMDYGRYTSWYYGKYTNIIYTRMTCFNDITGASLRRKDILTEIVIVI